MLLHYVTIYLRTALRQKGYVLINLLGLVTGMTCAILIGSYIQDELSYDRYHERANSIYRVAVDEYAPGRQARTATTPLPMADALRREFPEITSVVRIYHPHTKWMISYQDKRFYESGFFLADPQVFDVFSFPFIKGDPKTALQTPDAVVLTESTARKYFGASDPIGQVIRRENSDSFTVTGIVEDVPSNSHFHFDFLGSLAWSESHLSDTALNQWGRADGTSSKYYTYILLPEGYDSADLEAKFPTLIEKYMGHQEAQTELRLAPRLQALPRIHLYSHLENEIEANGDIAYVYGFAAIAFFILLLACVNFTNLSTARATRRAREVGMRKTIGATRAGLMGQFIGEVLLLASIASLIAFALAWAFLAEFNALLGKELHLNPSGNFWLWGSCIGLILLVGVMGGAYPAFFLSSFQPVEVLKGILPASNRKTYRLRRGLVILQFSISITLTICTAIIVRQLQYVQTRHLGFDKEQVVLIAIHTDEAGDHYDAYKQAISQDPRVLAVTKSTIMPGHWQHLWTSLFHRADAPDDQIIEMRVAPVAFGFPETLGLELAAGRFFSPDRPSDPAETYIINETAMRRMGWTSPDQAVGQTIEWLRTETGSRQTRTIIGVLKDFHLTSLHKEIEPVVLFQGFSEYFAAVKIKPDNIPATLDLLAAQWRTINADSAFEYSFLSADLDRLYHAEERIGKLVGIFGLLAVFIACIGLFGLIAFMAEQRTREIGIRKVLGASIPNIVALLSRDFIWLVFVSNALAWPAGYLIMRHWLDNFAYRTDLSAGIFLTAGSATLVIAVLTVGGHALKAAIANPADSLRYE